MTEAFIAQAGAHFATEGFFEPEIARRVEEFGRIAHVFSTYETRRAAGDAAPFARGINSIQLVRGAAGWRVLTIFWDTERPGSPIPPQYLG